MTAKDTLAAHRHVRLGDTRPTPSGCWCGFGVDIDATPEDWAAHALDALAEAGHAVIDRPSLVCTGGAVGDIEITASERGFEQYGESVATDDGTLVRVYESSAASGPHVWMSVASRREGRQGDVEVYGHLNEAQARAVIARLQAFIDRIPQRWTSS